MDTYPIPSLTVDRFFGIDKLEVPLMGQLNLFACEQARGKTSILEALWFLAQSGDLGVLTSALAMREALTPGDWATGHLDFETLFTYGGEPKLAVGAVDDSLPAVSAELDADADTGEPFMVLSCGDKARKFDLVKNRNGAHGTAECLSTTELEELLRVLAEQSLSHDFQVFATISSNYGKISSLVSGLGCTGTTFILTRSESDSGALQAYAFGYGNVGASRPSAPPGENHQWLPGGGCDHGPMQVTDHGRVTDETRARVRRLVAPAASQTHDQPPPQASDVMPCDVLNDVLSVEDPYDGLWELVKSGWAAKHLPEMPALDMEQDSKHRHKDVLWHTIVVTAQAPLILRVRLAALFHDIGKPATRSFEHGKVTFRHHEAVGAKITRRRMLSMGYDEQITADITRMVQLSGRFKGYDGWADSAVRRYVRDAGPLLHDLLALVRADCTTRHAHKREALHNSVDQFEVHIARLESEEAEAALRPEIDGAEVMRHLGIKPGPQVGAAMRFLLGLRRDHGVLGRDEVFRRLDEWWAHQPEPPLSA